MRESDRHGRKKVNTISMYILMLCMSTLTCWCKKENMEDRRKSGENEWQTFRFRKYNTETKNNKRDRLRVRSDR